MIPVSIDCETRLIGPEAALPDVICMGVACRVDGEIVRQIYAGDDAYDALDALLDDPDVLIVNQTLAFDLGVMFATFGDRYPSLITKIFDCLDANRMVDISIREKLIALGTHGELAFWELPNGTRIRAEYNLGALGRRYLGKTRTDKKSESTWRTNFHLLEGWRVEDYPQDAVAYLYEDISDPLEIYELQEELIEAEFLQSHMDACQFRRTEFDFCLKLISAWGFDTDEAFKQTLLEKVNAEYHHPDTMRKLVAAGWIRPAVPARPHKNGALNGDGTPKMTKARKASKNKKKIQAYVEAACAQHGVDVRYTDPSDSHPQGQVSFSKEALLPFEGLDPVIDEFITRNKLEKLATTEVPRMSGGRVVRPNFDVLKKTGRISSYAGKDPLYPAFNSQNVDPRARGAFVAREGHVMVSADYSSNELVSAAQIYLNVVGWSVLADTINAGIGPHEYLGAQLALYLDDDFRDECERSHCKTPTEVYEKFYALKSEPSCGKGCGSREKKCHLEGCLKGFYKHYRTFAKPTGLGYPGGLGPKTFITYAKGTFGITVDLETAKILRQIWRRTYPEVVEFAKWINHSCVDPRRNDRYAYTSPMGMVRSGCMYTEATNGCALQTPSAEWMMMACIRIVREQYDPSLESCLLGTHTLTPLHDEIIAEIPEDEHMTERACRISAIMIEAGEEVAPDLTHSVDPVLMRVWNKQADTVWCPETETLGIWSPK